MNARFIVPMLLLRKDPQLKCNEWIALGCDIATDTLVDVIVFAQFPPGIDQELDSIIATNLPSVRKAEIDGA